jgi:hypothetical protein
MSRGGGEGDPAQRDGGKAPRSLNHSPTWIVTPSVRPLMAPAKNTYWWPASPVILAHGGPLGNRAGRTARVRVRKRARAPRRATCTGGGREPSSACDQLVACGEFRDIKLKNCF